MLLWILAVAIVLAAAAVLGYLVATMMVPEVAQAFVNGDETAALLMSAVTVALVAIAVLAVAAGLRGHHEAVRARLATSPLVGRWRRRRLRSQALASADPVLGVKLGEVRWDDPAAEPRFAGASGGNPYARADVAHCGGQLATTLCVDQHADHRCGFYAVPSRAELLAELTGQRAPDPAEWSRALASVDTATHVLTVALHGEVISYDHALRGQRQTVTAIDVPARCTQEWCGAPLAAVAALGHPVALCALHASSPELAAHTLPVAEFERRFDVALRPTTETGESVDRSDLRRRPTGTPVAEPDAPAPGTPVDHRAERVEGWIAGSYDLEHGQLVTDDHRLDVDVRTDVPVTARRAAPALQPGQALARVRLGGEVTVRRDSVASRDVQMWDLYLPAQCQRAGCDEPAELVDADGSRAVARCRAHASEQARPAEQHSAAHGVAVQLGS